MSYGYNPRCFPLIYIRKLEQDGYIPDVEAFSTCDNQKEKNTYLYSTYG